MAGVVWPRWLCCCRDTQIAMRLQGVTPERPLTHDLFAATLEELGERRPYAMLDRLGQMLTDGLARAASAAGVPHRIKGLESALKYIKSHDQVWFATGSEIARHYVQSGACI